jgi:hypothetical protein
MQSYTLWVVSDPLGQEVLLVAESPDGTFAEPRLAKDEDEVRRFLRERGMPRQIDANVAAAVRFVRQAEPRLFQVPATVLKPKELAGPLATIALRARSTRP